MDSYDVIVIGMGPGGEHVAGTLAERGLSVLGVERGLVGGECPYWGCIPSKMMIRASNALAEARRVPGLAGTVGDVRPDWSLVARRIRDEASHQRPVRTDVPDSPGKSWHPAGLGQRVAGADHHLRGDAPPVGALAPDEAALHPQHAQSALRQGPCDMLAAWAHPDHDDVVRVHEHSLRSVWSISGRLQVSAGGPGPPVQEEQHRDGPED